MIQPYIIHNPKREDRRQLLINEMLTQGIMQYNLLPAIPHPVPKTGIALAHKNAVLEAKANKLPYVVVMEDDVQFVTPNAYQHFCDTINKLPQEADLLLGGISTGHIKDLGNGLGRLNNEFSGLFCYVIFERFYKTFLNCPEGKHIDRWSGSPYGGKANTFITYPLIARCHDTPSDNNRGNRGYSHLFNRYKYIQ